MFEKAPNGLDRLTEQQVFMNIGKPLVHRAPRLPLRTLILLGLLVLVALAGLVGLARAAERGETGLAAAAGGLTGLGETGEKGPRGPRADKIPPLEKLENFSGTDHASAFNFLEFFSSLRRPSPASPLPAPFGLQALTSPASTYNDLDAFAIRHPRSHETALKLMGSLAALLFIGFFADLRARSQR